MIRLPGTITYTDGREERIEVTQAEYAGYERWAVRSGLDPNPEGALPFTMTRYLGYQAVMRHAHLDREAWRDFDAWELDVADVTLDVPEDGIVELPPTVLERLAE